MANLAEPLVVSPAAFRARPGSLRLRLTRIAAWPSCRRFMLVLLALYVVKQGLFVLAFQPFSGHDEVAHYSYVRTVATEGRLPVLPDLDRWRAAVLANQDPVVDQLPAELYRYCLYTLDWFCDQTDPRWARNPPRIVTLQGVLYPSGFQYAANHPPLYYLVMTPLYVASAGLSPVAQHYLLRLAAIPFGLATVFFAYRLAHALFPGDVFLAVTVPTFVAFQPQISYEAAMVNNDIVCIALYSWILVLVVHGIRDRFPNRSCLLLGLALGLGLLTKGTAVTAAVVIALAIVLAIGWRNARGWLRRGVLVGIPAALLVAPWYLFLYRTYGNFDGLDQVAALQYWNRPAGTFLDLLTDRDFVVMRFKETWGEFGWRLIHLSPTLLWAIALPTIVALGGLVQFALTAGRDLPGHGGDPVMRPARWQWQGLAVLGAACLAAYLAIVEFGTRFELTQARYYFPAVNAASLLMMLGLRTLTPRPARALAQGAVFAVLVLLNVLIFSQYVIPYYLSA